MQGIHILLFYFGKKMVTGGMYGDKNTCKPYVFPPCEHHQIPGPCDIEYRPTPKCENKCQDGYEKTIEEDGMETIHIMFRIMNRKL